MARVLAKVHATIPRIAICVCDFSCPGGTSVMLVAFITPICPNRLHGPSTEPGILMLHLHQTQRALWGSVPGINRVTSCRHR